jgi:hypothetical protein
MSKARRLCQLIKHNLLETMESRENLADLEKA